MLWLQPTSFSDSQCLYIPGPPKVPAAFWERFYVTKTLQKAFLWGSRYDSYYWCRVLGLGGFHLVELRKPLVPGAECARLGSVGFVNTLVEEYRNYTVFFFFFGGGLQYSGFLRCFTVLYQVLLGNPRSWLKRNQEKCHFWYFLGF